MSGTILPNPVGQAGRRRLYSQALSPAQMRAAGPAAMDVPTFQAGPTPGPTVDPGARRGMFAQALRTPSPEPSFQPISSLGMAGAAPASREASPLAEAPGTAPTASVPGAEDRISTRVPRDVKAEERDAPHTRNDLEVGIEAARADPKAWKKNADLIRSYKHINTDGLSDDEVHEKYIQHLTDNLTWLHNQTDPTIRESSKRWYDGARAIAERWADEYRLQPRQVAAVLASLSPQKDWFQNVDLAKRILDMHRNSQNYIADAKMHDRLQSYVNATKDLDDRAVMQQHANEIAGRSLAELTDPFQRAMWMRAHDEAHNDRSYKVVTPEGEFGDTATTKGGKAQKVAWGSFNEIHKAMQALNDPSLENISRHMGGNHKVRNFYNNIISPNFGRDATVDTHAIAAANMMPEGSKSELVKAGLGMKGASSAGTGSRGMYPHYIEAHRRAAEKLGILPRELQSITWEGVRGLFTPEAKRDEAFVNEIHDIWHRAAQGEYDNETARQKVLARAAPQGIRDPGWVRRGVEDDA